ncbi:MAG: hypothetical protein N2A99_06425 [Carnobacterium alterfunditum]
MVLIIEALIKTIAYSMLFLGIARLVFPLMKDFFRLQKRTYRIKKVSHSTESGSIKKRTNKLHEHIEMVVKALAKRNDENAVMNFYLLTGVLVIATTIVMFVLLHSIPYAFLIALAVAVMPYVWKRFQLAGKRMEIAYAFMKEFHILLQAYQTNKDVYHSLVQSVKSIKDPKLKFSLMKVISSMQKDRNLYSFQESMKLFVFTVNTSFATRFANLLIKEFRDNVDISEALLDLHVDLQKREKDMASLKTKRMETIVLGYMPLAIIPIFLLMGRQMTIMYSSSQMFEDRGSVLLFTLALFVAIISAMSAYLLNKPNADI